MTATGSRHLIDEELLSFLDGWPALDLSAEMLPALRAQPLQFPVDEADIARTEMSVRDVPGPVGAPDVKIVIYRPRESSGPLPCIVHMHGGGFIVGSALAFETFHRPMTADLDCCIVSVEYRLAPESRFPDAIEDCYAALKWVFAHARELGVDTARIGAMGESAGGGLAAALALLVRDRGELKLAFQHLIYPMLDDRTCVTSDPHPYAGEFLWTASSNRFGWARLLGVEPGSPGVSPYAAPARAEDLSGLPPTFISTAMLDIFVEEDIEYARRLMRSGVPVELHVYPGAFHGFDLMPTATVARAANRDSHAALARALHKKGLR